MYISIYTFTHAYIEPCIVYAVRRLQTMMGVQLSISCLSAFHESPVGFCFCVLDLQVCSYIFIYLLIQICIYVCVDKRIYMFVYMNICGDFVTVFWTSRYLYIFISVLIYMYICVFWYTYLYVYIYKYMRRFCYCVLDLQVFTYMCICELI
jgi:hypothetical protein